MANPVLSEKVFNKAHSEESTEVMTVKGTAFKSIVLIFMVLAGAAYTWKVFYEAINPASVTPWMWGGAIGGFIVAIIISFNQIWLNILHLFMQFWKDCFWEQSPLCLIRLLQSLPRAL